MEPNVKRDNKSFEVVLNGGLGNQLFGWSMGYAVSLRNGYELKLNSSELTGRPYELGKLGILADSSSPKFKSPFSPDLLSRVKRKISIRLNLWTSVYAEKNFRYDPAVKTLPSGSTLYGYFQSWKYFEEYGDDIKKRIKSHFPESQEYLKFRNELSDADYFAIHVRRGDYVGREDFHGLTTAEYYSRALERVGLRPSEEIICFSDSIEMAKEVLPNCSRYFGPESVNDPVTLLRIMSEAKGIIGSNSSLSWWSAYLMDEEKIKIFPAKWFANSDLDTTDLIPPEWQTLD
jgi:hypothetical protein